MQKRLIALLRKEYAQLFRDKVLLFFLVWSFTVSQLVAGNGLSMEIHNHPFVVYDQSQSAYSRELLSRLQEPYFRLLASVHSDAEVVAYLDSGKASMAVIIPPDFARQIAKGDVASFQIISDGTISLSATLAPMYVAQIARDYTIDNLEYLGSGARLRQSVPTVNAELRVEYNPNSISAWFSGLINFINMATIIPLLLSAAAMIREKEYGTIEQLMVTPARSVEIFLAKIIPNVLVVIPLSVVGLYGILKGVFGLPIIGNIFLFYVVMTLYVFVMSSLGIQVALIAKNLPQVIMIILLLLIPMILLSGAFTPPESMSTWMRRFGLILPMRYFIEFAFGVLLKGNPVSYVWPSILGLVVMGAGLFISSMLSFYKHFSK